jgi:hypothetical protein
MLRYQVRPLVALPRMARLSARSMTTTFPLEALMTDTPTPPPHLLKKFSAEAHAESSKRNGAGYMKTFARLCIEWAKSKPTSNLNQIRSSDIVPPPEMVQQWNDKIYGGPGVVAASDDICLAKLAAQWGADLELGACCALMDEWGLDGNDLMECRRPNPPSLKQQALAQLDLLSQKAYARDFAGFQADTIRAALETLDD